MKRLLLIMAVFIALVSSCADTDSAGELISSCAGITCSGHGKCESNDGIPACLCDSGYINTGSECLFDCSNIENSKINIYNNGCECLGDLQAQRDESNNLISCSCEEGKELVNGQCLTKCDDANAYPTNEGTCVCNYGYYLDISGICTFNCKYNDHAFTNSANNACECEEGYELKNGECLYSCNEAGNMITNGGNNGCSCKEGYFQTKDADVCASPCEGVSCENDAECVATSSESNICRCIANKSLKLNYNDNLIMPMPYNTDMKIATNAGNTYAIVWSGNTSDTDSVKSIFLTILNSDGTILKETSIINLRDLNDDKNKLNPTVIWGGDKYLVAWEDSRYTTDTMTTKDIYFRLVSEDGTLTPETRLTFSTSNNTYAWAPKLLWNEVEAHYAIFWKEKKRDIDGNLGVTTVYYRLIRPTGDYLIGTKPTTAANIPIYDFDITLNKDNNYSMVWIKDESPKRLYYQILSSDSTVIESDGVVLLSPINLLYNTSSAISPKIIWNGSEYAIFFRNSSYSNRYALLLLNENNQKLGNEINLNLSDTPRDFFWNGNEYVFTTNNSNEVYLRKISWDGRIIENNLLSDGLHHIYNPRVSFVDKNDYSFFWIDNRDGSYSLYSSDMSCR